MAVAMASETVYPVPPNTKINPVLLLNERVTVYPGAEMLRRAQKITDGAPDPIYIDNACGAGIIAALIQQDISAKSSGPKPKVIAADKDPAMIATVRTRAEESGWTNYETMLFDAAAIKLRDDSVSHILTNFGIIFTPNDDEVLRETLRVLRPGGVAGYTSWVNVSWWAMARRALAKYLPDAPPLEESVQTIFTKGWDDSAVVQKKMEEAGFKDVTAEYFDFGIDIGPDDFGLATSLLVKAVSMVMWDASAREKFGPNVQGAIVKYLKETYPDGIFNEKMTALITLGKK